MKSFFPNGELRATRLSGRGRLWKDLLGVDLVVEEETDIVEVEKRLVLTAENLVGWLWRITFLISIIKRVKEEERRNRKEEKLK